MTWVLFKEGAGRACLEDESVSGGGGARKAEPERRGPGQGPEERNRPHGRERWETL